MEFQGRFVGREQPFDFIGSMGKGVGDHKGPAAVVAELVHLSCAGIAVDLDAAGDDVADLVGDELAGGVGQMGCVESPFFSQDVQDLSGEGFQ